MKIYRICSNKIIYNSIWNQIFCTAILDMIFVSICLVSYLMLFQARTSRCFVEEVLVQIWDVKAKRTRSHQIRCFESTPCHTHPAISENTFLDCMLLQFKGGVTYQAPFFSGEYVGKSIWPASFWHKKNIIYTPRSLTKTLINGVFKTILCHWVFRNGSGGVSCWTSGGV